MDQVSVVIPTLGRPSLPEAVASALDQTHMPRRIVIVYNGPIDGAVELPAPSEIPIDVHRLPYRSGPSVPRNLGAMFSPHPFVAFLDDDDVFTSTYLERMTEARRVQDADIVVGTRVTLDGLGSVCRRSNPRQRPVGEWLSYLLSGQNPGVGAQNLMVRRTTFLGLGGFSPRLSSGEDREFIIRALSADTVVATAPEAEVHLRIPAGVRASGNATNTFDDLRILGEHWEKASLGDKQRFIRSLFLRHVRAYREQRRV